MYFPKFARNSLSFPRGCQMNISPIPGCRRCFFCCCYSHLSPLTSHLRRRPLGLRRFVRYVRGDGVQQELDVIRDELDRAGNLLLQMSHTDTVDQGDDGVELNAELESLARILEDSLFSSDSRSLRLSLCSEPTRVAAGPTRIRQIVINLVRITIDFDHQHGASLHR